MNHSQFLLLAFSLLLLGLFSSSSQTAITGDAAKKQALSEEAFEDYVSFTARQRGQLASAQEVFMIDLPRDPISCIFEGEWRTDNDPWGRQRRYCHAATGSFTSYIDSTQQYVVNDPGFFPWAGLSKPKVNPPAMTYDGYALYMRTCDNRYYQEERYTVTARVTQFSQQLELTWDYFDDDTQPAVDFMFTVTCTLEKEILYEESMASELEEPSVSALTAEEVFFEREATSLDNYEVSSRSLYSVLVNSLKTLLRSLFI